MMLMTPLTAFAPQMVPPGPRMTSMRSMSASTRSCTSQYTPSKQRCVDAAAVNENEQPFGELAVEATNADGPLIALLARNIDAGDEPEELRDAGRAGTADVILREHSDCGRSLPQLFGFLGGGGDLDVSELCERELFELLINRWLWLIQS